MAERVRRAVDPVPSTIVRLGALSAVVPEECACCGRPGTRVQRELRWLDRRSLMVPYCGECHRHVSVELTRRFAVASSTGILSLTLAVGLPLVVDAPPLPFLLVVVALAGLAPALASAFFRRRLGPAHHSCARAAYFRWDGALVCLSPGWGDALARASGVPAERGRAREELVSPAVVAAWVASLLLAPVVYFASFSPVYVVNATAAPFSIWIDGARRQDVLPSSAESLRGAAVLRVAAGSHTLSVHDPEGRVLETARVEVRSGRDHLYAPVSRGTCFWIETTGYGRRAGDGTTTEALDGASRFWTFEEAVDQWFVAAPPPEADRRSSGGLFRVLRRAPCAVAPEPVRARLPGEVPPGAPPPFATDAE